MILLSLRLTIALVLGGIFAALACMETAFSRFSGFSDGGTAVDAGAGGIGFFSVLASETGGSIAGAVEEAMLFPVADCFSWISDWGKTFDCITSLFEGSGGFAG